MAEARPGRPSVYLTVFHPSSAFPHDMAVRQFVSSARVMVAREAVPPQPASLSHLRPRDRTAAAHSLGAAATTAAGIWLSLQTRVPLWAAGEALLALGLVQWFVLLHESGHGTLF